MLKSIIFLRETIYFKFENAANMIIGEFSITFYIIVIVLDWIVSEGTLILFHLQYIHLLCNFDVEIYSVEVEE